MLALPGIIVQAQIYESANSLVYRAIREQDNQRIILKVLKENYPTPQELARYRTEYQITKSLDLPGVAKVYDLQKYHNTLVMIVEDFGGESLKTWHEQHQFSLEEFLVMAIAITETLGQIHAAHIIYKDLNPANIVYNRTTQELKIIDFGISTQLTRETPTFKNPNILEGTLAYISPEQTGRMNRYVDYRTDFYSLGVTFYELLAKQLPFETLDPLELVHCHIAKQPLSPNEINPEVPLVLSAIVLKLMAKTAEERYQSAAGIKADLEQCLIQLKETGRIDNFAIAAQDISDKFQIPQKLYGREAEIKTLLAAFERVYLQSEIFLIAGYSGIGKSALVQELYQPITQSRGYFIAGKFDQYQHNIPYSAVVNALKELVNQLLTASETELQQWKSKLLSALGENGQIIISVIPELELIIGKQPGVPELGAAEAQNRFNFVFQSFIKVFTKPEHPLTVFLDDLQWADEASLQLIQLLMKHSSGGLFLIGAYRDNEVSATHPLMLVIDEIIKNETIINRIFLTPLELTTTEEIIADVLNAEVAIIKPLAELVQLKTGGNPFFINEFLKSLHAENLLKFNFKSLCWEWDLERIQRRGFSDNVVELMAFKIQKLPENAQQILKIAACIGNRFDLKTLELSSQKPLKDNINYLNLAINESLIISLGKMEDVELAIGRSPAPKAIAATEFSDDTLLNSHYQLPEYQFIHDRVQQAAYSLIPETERAIAHYQIGKLLLQEIPANALEEKIFIVVNQLNYGIDLIAESTEREQLAKLNLAAATKARLATAYQAALEFAQIGINLLGEAGWQRQYEMNLNLHELGAEVAALCGKFDLMEQWVDAIINHAKTSLEKINVYIIKIQALASQHQLSAAISLGISLLQELGCELPSEPTAEDIRQAVEEIDRLIGERSIEAIFDLPVMVDPQKLAIMQVAASILPPCYNAGSLLFLLIATLQVSLSLQYGNSPIAAFSYACYGIVLNNFTGNVTAADRFGKLAYRMASQVDAQNVRSATLVPIGLFLHHRKSHLRGTLPICRVGYQAGLETGNLEMLGYNIEAFCRAAYWCGQPLTELAPQIRVYYQQLLDFNQVTTASYARIFWEATLFLLGNPDKLEISFEQSVYGNTFLAQLLSAQDYCGLFSYYLHRAIVKFSVGDLAQAAADIMQSRQYIAAGEGYISEAGLYFYDSLITLATITAEMDGFPEQQQRINQNQSHLKYWAEHAPMNYLHKWQLVEAEKYRILGNKAQAMDFYDEAIAGAKEHGYIQEEALANELAAKFYLSQGKQLIATAYMQEAHYHYQIWGAAAKVQYLEKRYPQLFAASKSTTKGIKYTIATTTDSSANLDIATVMKASQAISGEIELDKLLSSLMKILIENAGAQRGYLILSQQGQLLIQAEGTIDSVNMAFPDKNPILVLQSIPVSNFQGLSELIVNYVARTKESVVLNNAIKDGKFSNDSYIKNYQPKSILCAPLINQGKLISIVYLENNLIPGAFTQERLEILNLLSSQAAISIENAKLYTEVRENQKRLEQFNKAYERFVPRQFLQFLNKSSVVEVELGDQVQLEMSVLFSDIRDFTSMSEKMTPEDNFKFINAYLSCMEPAITENHGFIDKYIGDAIMALFSGTADNAVKAGISMLYRLREYNQHRANSGYVPIQIGIGINTGLLMLGTVGGQNRMDSTVISDAVNLASRVENLTKNYGVSLLIAEQTYRRLSNPANYAIRIIDQAIVKGKSEAVTIYEVFEADLPEIKAGKLATLPLFAEAVSLYNQGRLTEAGELFGRCWEQNPGDRVSQIYYQELTKKS